MEELKDKLSRIRINKGLSQNFVAKKAGITQPYYASIEKGDSTNLTLKVAKGISLALEISFNELFDIPLPQQNDSGIDFLHEEISRLKNQLSDKEILTQMLIKKELNTRLNFVEFLCFSYDLVMIQIEFISTDLKSKSISISSVEENKLAIMSFFENFKQDFIKYGILTELDFEEFYSQWKVLRHKFDPEYPRSKNFRIRPAQ
jgi:transcriptional regulator with XRE-family HTH domain